MMRLPGQSSTKTYSPLASTRTCLVSTPNPYINPKLRLKPSPKPTFTSTPNLPWYQPKTYLHVSPTHTLKSTYGSIPRHKPLPIKVMPVQELVRDQLSGKAGLGTDQLRSLRIATDLRPKQQRARLQITVCVYTQNYRFYGLWVIDNCRFWITDVYRSHRFCAMRQEVTIDAAYQRVEACELVDPLEKRGLSIQEFEAMAARPPHSRFPRVSICMYNMYICVCIHIYMYMYMYTCTYKYIEIEIERERERVCSESLYPNPGRGSPKI